MNYLVLLPVKYEARGKKTITACHGCLDTERKLYDLRRTNLDQVFRDLTGLQVSEGQLCSICARLLQRFQKFRVQCLNASYILRQAETVKECGGSYYDMFESIFRESLVYTDDFNEEDLDEDKEQILDGLNADQNLIWEYLSLHKRLERLYSLKIEFLSLERQWDEMVEKRRSGKYEKEHCKLCCKKFVSEDTLKRHLRGHHDQNLQYECRICLYRFKRRDFFVRHVGNHSKRVTCTKCGGKVSSEKWYELQDHKKMHDVQKERYPCDFCDKTFKFGKLRCMHIRQCHRDKIDVVLCLMCGDTYNGPTGLRNHVVKIHKEAMKCNKCKVYFADGTALSSHCGGEGCIGGQSSCPLCGANFTTEQLMMEHYYKHKQCSMPRKRVATKRKRGDAKRMYNRKYNQHIICEICGKGGFTCPATLEYHKRCHSGEKPFSCDMCGKSFRLKPMLIAHIRTHTDERRHQCELCFARFSQSSHLKTHMTVHSKEKLHFCDICAKSFAYRASMQEHKRMIHEGIPRKNPRKPKRKSNNKKQGLD